MSRYSIHQPLANFICYWIVPVIVGAVLGACGDRDEVTEPNDADATIKDSDVDGRAPVVSDLEVIDNPGNVLSCYVTWTTDVPSSSSVMFGEDDYEYEIVETAAATEHKVLVIGMHAETAYHIKAVSETINGAGEGTTSYRTGALPDLVAVPEVGITNAADAEPGWTLLNLSDMSAQSPPPLVAVMYDFDGRPVWYYVNDDAPDSHGDTPLTLMEDNRIAVGATAYAIPPREIDLAGNVLWEGPPQVSRSAITHEFRKLPDGNYAALREVYNGTSRGDMVEVFRPNHSVVFQWNTFDYVDWAPLVNGDWSHCNSVTVDLDEKVFFLSCRNFSNIFKVSTEGDMAIVWRFGEGGDFAADSSSNAPWFAEQHDPEIQPNGNILVYDNGTLERHASRVVEYALDEAKKKATIVWEFPGDFTVDSWYREKWFTNYWGDADRQPNGNTLVVAGNIPGRDGEPSRIFEVTAKGKVVWEISLPNNGVYRAQRVSPPLLRPIK